MKENTLPLEPKRHIYLYAKNWYKQSGNVWKDLRKIISNYSGTESRYITHHDIVMFLASLVQKHSHEWENSIYDLFDDIMGTRYFNRFRKYPVDKRIVLSILGMLAITSVKDNNDNWIMNLGEPDYSILKKNDMNSMKV